MDIIQVKTKGHYDFINITELVSDSLAQSELVDGAVLIFVSGSTAALTTVEYEDGVLADIKEVLENIAPEYSDYKHHQKWGDANGAAHIKAALIGPDLVVPVQNNKLMLGQWQEIVLIDFDEKSRNREIIIEKLS